MIKPTTEPASRNKVTAPTIDHSRRDEVRWMRAGAVYLGSLMPLRNLAEVRALAGQRITAFSTDAIPRTTRAQAMDTLSSMANIIRLARASDLAMKNIYWEFHKRLCRYAGVPPTFLAENGGGACQ